METTWMKSPDGEVREVPVDGAIGELNRLMVAGWSQCEKPTGQASEKPTAPPDDRVVEFRKPGASMNEINN